MFRGPDESMAEYAKNISRKILLSPTIKPYSGLKDDFPNSSKY